MEARPLILGRRKTTSSLTRPDDGSYATTDKRSNGDATSELLATIDDLEAVALIDTGADYSVFSSVLAKKLKKVLT